MTKTLVTYYDVLGLSPAATDTDVRRQYRTLALRWHPDHNPQNIAAAHHYTALLNQAYAHLRTAPQRRAYDRALLAAATARPLPAPDAPLRGQVGQRSRQTEKKPTMIKCTLTLLKDVFWPLAPQEARHGG